MTKDIYILPRQYNQTIIKDCCGVASGIIVGDVFCQKRMYENDCFDIPDACKEIKSAGLRVIFQTPAYNTTRSIESTLSLIRKLDSENLLHAIFIHDPGMLAELGKKGNYELWWDRYSFNRDIIPGKSLIRFLLSNGITKVEIQNFKDIQTVSEAGIGVLFDAYGPNISTFGRICYTEYFTHEPCERKILCKNINPFISSGDKIPVQYEVDGYFLINKTEPILDHISELDNEILPYIDGIILNARKEDIKSISEKLLVTI